MTQEEADRIIAQVLDASPGDETEVSLGGGRSALTRFARNAIHQNVEESWLELKVRTVEFVGARSRVGSATTRDLSEEGIRAVLDRAWTLTGLAPELDDYPGLPHPGYYASTASHDGANHDRTTAESGPAYRANQVAEAVLPLQRPPTSHASGYYRITEGAIGDYGDSGVIAIANTSGIARYDYPTEVDCAVSVRASHGGTGWATSYSHERDDVDLGAAAQRAAAKAELATNRQELPPGAQRVLLEPPAVASLLAFAASAFSQRALDEGRSYFSGQLDSAQVGEVNLRADPSDERLRVRPFDGVGIPSSPIQLLRDGQPVDFATGYDDERRLGTPCNGYTPIQPSGADPVPRGLVLEGGDGSVDELIARTDNALLVTRLWYNRFVDARALRVTGMTRDGFFRLDDGEIARALVDMRYNVAVFDILSRVVDASEPVRIGDMLVPALVVDGFDFTSATVGQSDS